MSGRSPFQRHSLLIICKNIKSSIHVFHFIYYFVSQLWWLLVPSSVLSSFWALFCPSSVFLIELRLNLPSCFYSPQCCKRKLVAMLMSLFDALRASSASILEKPISTSRATCRGRTERVETLAAIEYITISPREINKVTLVRNVDVRRD